MFKINLKKPGTINIITTYSAIGGSTVLFIELCRLFNDNNMPSVFYGPQIWHMTQYEHCKLIKHLKINSDDYVIGHMLDSYTNNVSKGKRNILSIHEKSGYFLVPEKLTMYDTIVFASQSHMEWHDYYKGPQHKVVIPTPQANLKKITKIKPEAIGVAGIIGQSCLRKQTHVSIIRALKDGCRKVILFGDKNEIYFKTCVAPLLSDKVIYYGEIPMNKRQEMYEMISCVYHSSTEEIACLVQSECKIVGLPFHGNCNIIPYETWDASKIIEAWRKLLRY